MADIDYFRGDPHGAKKVRPKGFTWPPSHGYIFPYVPKKYWPWTKAKNIELREEAGPNTLYTDAEGSVVFPEPQPQSDPSLTSRFLRAPAMTPAPPKDIKASEEASPFLNPVGTFRRYLRKKLVEEPDAKAAERRALFGLGGKYKPPSGAGKPGLHPNAFKASMGLGNSPDLIEHQRY